MALIMSPISETAYSSRPSLRGEMKRFWDKPFSHLVPIKGFLRLDIQGMEDLVMVVPPPFRNICCKPLAPVL